MTDQLTSMGACITFQSSRNAGISMTQRQIAACDRAGVWPTDSAGEEMARVSHGLHFGRYATDAQVEAACGVEPGAIFGEGA